MRFGSVPPRNWQKAHGTMISHEKSTNDISNIVNVIYGGMLALMQNGHIRPSIGRGYQIPGRG